MLRNLIVAASLIGLTAAAVAQDDPIATRRNIMKGVGQASRTGIQMSKGEVPFDLAKAKAVFKTYGDASERMPGLFPDTSKTGGETTAAPKIWETFDDFKGRFASWDAEVKKASADTKDLDSFKVAFGTVTKACGTCHELYRVKK